MNTSALVEIRDVSVTYAARRRKSTPKVALAGVDLDIGPGETVGLVGESGSGKSTLGNVVLGLVPATAGTVTFDGRDITRLRPAERRPLSQDIQAVFQDPYSSFNPNRTVGQTVSETLSTQKLSPKQAAAEVGAMLEKVGLDRSAAEKFPAQFSGGQRQRIAIARALLPRPRLVVCDESVSALDLSVQAQILNLLAELQREFGVAYLFITHDLSVVRHVSHRVVVLRRGEIVEQGTNRAVIDAPEQPYTRALLAAAPVPDPALQKIRSDARRAMVKLGLSVSSPDGESPDTIGATSGTELEQSIASLNSVMPLRRALERKAAYEAAQAHDTITLAPIADALNRMETSIDRDAFTAADVDFHHALLAASTSPDAGFLPTVVTTVVDHSVRAGADHIHQEQDIDDLRALHRAVYEAITTGDGELAVTRVDQCFQWLDHALARQQS